MSFRLIFDILKHKIITKLGPYCGPYSARIGTAHLGTAYLGLIKCGLGLWAVLKWAEPMQTEYGLQYGPNFVVILCFKISNMGLKPIHIPLKFE